MSLRRKMDSDSAVVMPVLFNLFHHVGAFTEKSRERFKRPPGLRREGADKSPAEEERSGREGV